jgi:hypothetical protein
MPAEGDVEVNEFADAAPPVASYMEAIGSQSVPRRTDTR